MQWDIDFLIYRDVFGRKRVGGETKLEILC